MFDWTVNIGHILTIISFLVMGMGIVFTMRGRIDVLTERLEILEDGIKSLITILIQQGKQEERMTAMDQRMVNQGARLDDLTRRYNDQLNK